MPRDLADVLHYFLPELGDPPSESADSSPPVRQHPTRRLDRSDATRPASAPTAQPGLPLSILGVPLGDRELVHAACAWNLAVETARQGGRSVIVLPRGDGASAIAPPSDAAAHGVEVLEAPARDPIRVGAFARRIASERGRTAREGGIVFLRVPTAWLEQAESFDEALRWFLLFCAPGERDLHAAFERACRLAERTRSAEIGVALRGVRDAREARTSFDDLMSRCRQRLDLGLVRYGVLVDDLDLCRAIAAGRALTPARPDASGARALSEVARRLYEDARSRVLG